MGNFSQWRNVRFVTLLADDKFCAKSNIAFFHSHFYINHSHALNMVIMRKYSLIILFHKTTKSTT